MTSGPISSRRAFIAGLTASLAAAPAALANDPISAIINDPSRGGWNDTLDAGGQQDRGQVVGRTPIFSNQTIMNIERAIFEYRRIADAGGWPLVPAAQTLKLGSSGPSVAMLRRRLAVSGDLPAAYADGQTFDTAVHEAVRRFQTRHGAVDDGVVGPYSFKMLNVPASVRVMQLETNLIRLRSMSGFLGERYVMVNIPAAQIEAVGRSGRVEQRHKAVVGKIDRQTPILNSKIFEFNLNPYWTSPVSIVKKDIIPLMRKDPTYLEKNGIRILDRVTGDEIPWQAVDWNTDEAVNFMFRQDPGKINAMASVKINFPNPHAVYMHDTPQQSLFGKLMRFESSGCVRVHNVRDLLVWLSAETPEWNRQTIEQTIATGERVDAKLNAPVALYFSYITAWSTDPGVVHFRDDIYQRDGSAELALQ